MDKKDRLAHVTDRVHDEGTLRIDDIASHYPASPMTLYRDLQELENAGVLRRSRGYVTAVATSITETSMSFRRDQEAQEKEELAPAFESILVRGTSVLLDDSSTALALIGAYTHVDGLTVITNNRAILDLAMSVPAWDAIALGGKLDRHLDAYYGSAGMTMLKGMSADVVILSAAAITGGVVYHPYEEVAAYKALLLELSLIHISEPTRLL